VIPALIRRFHEARQGGLPSVTIWGSGTPRREFLNVDDLAAAAVHVMELPRADYDARTRPMQSHINVGSGEEFTIAELASAVAEAVGFSGAILFDRSKPDGAPRKLMNSALLRSLGWQPATHLREGLRLAYADFLQQTNPNSGIR